MPKTGSRGRHTIELRYLDPAVRRRFTAGLRHLGKGTQAQWLMVQVSRLIREAEARFGEDFDVRYLAPDERPIVEAIAVGGALTIEDICERLNLAAHRVRPVVAGLVRSEWLSRHRRGRGETVVVTYRLRRELPPADDGNE